MGNPDDIHNFPKRYENALQQLEQSDLSQRNKEIILKFGKSCKRKGNKTSTIAMNLNILRWIAAAIKKDIDSITEDDFDTFLDRLEAQGKDDSSYKKLIKKFFRMHTDDNPPKWIRELRLPQHDSPVQPSDLLTTAELDILLNACKHPRDKAFIAIHLDSCMRVGAIGTLRIKGVESNQCGGVLYMSTTSRNQKSTPPKPVPITWSMGYLNAWLDVHPDKNNPDAPLWVSLQGNKISAMTYPGLEMMLKRVLKRTGLMKKVHYHLFKHQKVTEMILNGYSDREIRFQAGWSPNSNHMFKIYGNFYDKDMVDSIYVRAGLSPQNKKAIKLTKCPRCHVILVPEARVCHQCALVLDAKLAMEIKDMESDVPDALAILMRDPAIMSKFQEALKKTQA